MDEPRVPRIGLVTDSDLNRHVLTVVLKEGGYELLVSLNSTSLESSLNSEAASEKLAELDAWLVDLAGSSDVQRVLDSLVERTDLPLLVNDDVPPAQDLNAHRYWKRRLLEKLEVVAVRSVAEPDQTGKDVFVEKVWVLAASTGGPEAIRRFLKALPSKLPLAIVYGQHIEASFDAFLANSGGSAHSYPMHLIRGKQRLKVGEIAVVPADRQLRFLPRGRVVETRKVWAGTYQPALDQVIADLARVYRHNLGVIVFSGMCNDGEIGCRVAKACGATVWVQSPESCISPDMPNAALSTGCVSYQGTPEQLAASLVEHINNKPVGNSTGGVQGAPPMR